MCLQLADPGNYLMNGYAVPMFVVGVTIACLGFFVLFRERASLVGASFLLVCLSVSLFLVSFGFDYASKEAGLSLFWIRISHLGVVFIPSSVLLLTLVLFGLSHRYSFAIAASFGFSLLFAIGIFLTDLFVLKTERFFWGNYPQYGPLGIAFLVFFFGIMAYILFLYWREYRRGPTEKNRQRIRGLFIAFSGGYLGSVDFLPALGITIYPFGYLPIFFFIFACTYVVIRYQLVDITPETAAGEILDVIKGGVIATDLEGKVRVANNYVHEMLGHLPGRLLGMEMQAIAPIPDDLVESIRTGKHISDYEMAWPGRTGQCWVSLSASLLSDKRNGELLGIVYAAYDITERKRVEENLRESEKVFHNLFNNTEVAMLRSRVDGSETLDANDKFLELVGRTREEVIGKASALHWVDPRQREEMLRRLRADGRVVDLELQMFNKKGEVRDCVSSLKLYPEEGILDGSILDITDRKKAEEKLKISEQQLRESQQVARIGHYVLDIQAGAWTSSEVLDDIFGIGPEYVRTFEGWLSLVHPDYQPEMLKYFTEQVLRDNLPFNRQYRIVRKSDGVARWVHGIGKLTVSSDGKPIRMFGTIQDVTERKMVEESLRENQEQLDLALQAAHMGVWRWEIK
ncbi:MAG TPA: PAS domain S-box protein, partial [Nitrospirota bacterium]|nr:PAS domain S-box protein [Nitrospirota bacterium]